MKGEENRRHETAASSNRAGVRTKTLGASARVHSTPNGTVLTTRQAVITFLAAELAEAEEAEDGDGDAAEDEAERRTAGILHKDRKANRDIDR